MGIKGSWAPVAASHEPEPRGRTLLEDGSACRSLHRGVVRAHRE